MKQLEFLDFKSSNEITIVCQGVHITMFDKSQSGDLKVDKS